MSSHPTIQAVAQAAGVSAATVSRVINGTARVNPAKVERVHQAMLQLGYRLPYLDAKQHLQQNQSTIGVMLPGLQDEAFGTLAHHLQKRLSELGYQMTCLLGHDDPQLEKAAIETFGRLGLGGCILLPRDLSDEHLLLHLSGALPTVLIGRHLPEQAGLCINFDNEQAGFLATGHLIELGHSRIAHITGPMNAHHTLARYTGYVKALQQAGLGVDPALVLPGNARDFDLRQGEILTRRLLNTTSFTAVFAYNDLMAVGAMRALQHLGLEVPHQVSVVGVGNRMVSQVVSPALTSVELPLQALGHAAVDHLLRLQKGGTFLPGLLPCHLEVRLSSSLAPMVVSSPLQT